MREDLTFHLGGSRAVVSSAEFAQHLQGHWKGQTFIGPNAAVVVSRIIARHRAQMSARMASNG